MEYTIIDKEKYARLKHFEHFSNLAYPYVGITVNVDITNWLKQLKSRKYPFFHTFLYAVGTAANRVPAMRQRIKDNDIIEFKSCLCPYTLALEDETYCYCILRVDMPLDEFLTYANEQKEKAKLNPSIEDGEDALSFFFTSSLPWTSFTSIIQPTPIPADSNPRIIWGKYFTENNKTQIPVSILCHHALVDGRHLSQFYQNLDEVLASMLIALPCGRAN